jgi:hypothetical protein
MKKILCLCIVMLFATQAFAEDVVSVPGESGSANTADTINWSGEFFHAAGGAVIAGVATAVANKYWPEHRALIGFSFSTACGIIGEGIDRYNYGEKFSSMLQDVAFNTLGAAIGSLITDKFILMPVVEREHAGTTYYGLAIQCCF